MPSNSKRRRRRPSSGEPNCFLKMVKKRVRFRMELNRLEKKSPGKLPLPGIFLTALRLRIIFRAGSLRRVRRVDRSAKAGIYRSPLCFPAVPARSAAAFPQAPERHWTRTGSGSRQIPREDFLHPKSTTPDPRRPAPPFEVSALQVPVVQPFLYMTRIPFWVKTPCAMG